MMSAVLFLCPDCGAPMVWLRGYWHCQCRQQMAETREAAGLELRVTVRLPESVSSSGPERWQVAEALAVAHRLEVDETGWEYDPGAHAMVARVKIGGCDG